MMHTFLLGVLIVSIFIGPLLFYVRKNLDLLRLWEAYDTAKLSGDKAKALEVGKAFYLRKKGRLTSYDAQTLASDLITLKD